MKTGQFYLVLLAINVGLLAMLLWMSKSPIFARYIDLPIIGLIVLNAFNILIFHFAQRLSRASLDKAYLSLVFMNVLVKLILVIGIPVVYYLIKSPDEQLFILPFVLIYAVFTIFETWYLNKGAIMRFH